MCNDTPAIQELTKMVSSLGSQMNRLAQTIQKSQQEVAKYVDEYSYPTSDTSIILKPQTSNPVLITAIITYVTSAATLTLGQRVFSLTPTGDNDAQFKGISIVLRQSDARTLVQATPGAMGLELMGIELPTTGVW